MWLDEPEFTPLSLSILRVHGVLVRSGPVAVPPEGLVIGSEAGEEGLNLNASFFVAPRHVSLYSQGSSWFLRHLDKHFQCAVNGRKLAWDESVELFADDVIELGFVTILARFGEGPESGAGPPGSFGLPETDGEDSRPGPPDEPPEASAPLSAAEELAALLAEPETEGLTDPLLAVSGVRPQEGDVFRPSEFPGSFTPEPGEAADILARLARESEGEGAGSPPPPLWDGRNETGKVHSDPLRLLDLQEGLTVEDVLEGPLTIDAVLERLDNGLPPPLLEPEPASPDPLALVGCEVRTSPGPSEIVAREHHHVKINTHYRNQGNGPPKAGKAEGPDDAG